MKKWNVKEFVERMLDAAPGLVPLYGEHIEENDELLPHLFMGRIDDFITNLLVRDRMRGAKDGEVEALKILGVIEEGLENGDEDVDNVIHVSFLEYMMSRDDYTYQFIEKNLGGRSLMGLRSMENWREPGLWPAIRRFFG